MWQQIRAAHPIDGRPGARLLRSSVAVAGMERSYDSNGTALREKPCEIEGFGYEPLRHSLPEVLGILLTSDESVDG